MSGHTPGPWNVGATNPYPDESDEIAVMGNNRCVAVAIPQGMKDENPALTQANARLIAAAPDLLEALNKIETIASTPSGWNRPIFQRGRIIKIAEAAIAKAEPNHD